MLTTCILVLAIPALAAPAEPGPVTVQDGTRHRLPSVFDEGPVTARDDTRHRLRLPDDSKAASKLPSEAALPRDNARSDGRLPVPDISRQRTAPPPSSLPPQGSDAPGIKGGEIISVGIALQVPSVNLYARGDVHATEVSSGEKFAFIPYSDYSAETDENQRVIIGNLSLSSPVKLIPLTKNDRMEVNGRTYRGNLLVNANPDQTITIVEELGIEEYLCGVLPLEMSPGWPIEALKAQAVVSRTFALKNMGKFKDSGFDISADMFSQVYGGSGYDDPRVLEAVRSTGGQVLMYKGELVPAYFHSCCGGRTTAPSSVWGAEILRPLAGISDPYCRNSPHYAWKTHIAARDILEALQRNGSTALRIRGIRITKRDRSGRTLKMKFVTDQGNMTVSAKNFRNWMGEKEIKSTYILRISPSKGGYIFAGRGWGHGVGMCQYGTRVMAERRKDYRRILQHYYPGARVVGTLLKD